MPSMCCYNPAQNGVANNGFSVPDVHRLHRSEERTADGEPARYYSFDKIANLLWIDAKLPFTTSKLEAVRCRAVRQRR